ncbi:PEP-CTERM sorting domain-containing protein [Nostoc parmelioides]|uniref:PEP-CTERM sorting domain-containing protein n=1 Tax=Nostoc parmelioides FACHB-3921 TaxID=2692909 RepID=A0ABR8BGU4_9NOSO|nr:PEP-CTERM sorting domain-containing protein [Nostoc parmelioides]MBD2252203.1 PEP-CTERM sorting domain-containing protein [Nostoc parmelioides FACHB-3921]
MKSIRNQIQATLAVAAVTSMATLANISSADAASYRLDWTGSQGYSAQGRFDYDNIFQGSVITRDQLSRFDISFFDPQGTLLQSFKYSFPNPSSTFNFNFDTVTGTVLQSGSFDTPNGFDLGIDFNTTIAGLSFYTYQGADLSALGLPTTIFLKDDLSPEVCDTFPNCRLDNGGQLTASVIPEPGVIFGLLAVGSLARVLKKKPASV